MCLRYEIKNSMRKPMKDAPMHAIPNLRGVFKTQEGNQSMIQVLAVLCVSNPCISISIPPLQKTSFPSSDILSTSSLIHSLNRTRFAYYLYLSYHLRRGIVLFQNFSKMSSLAYK